MKWTKSPPELVATFAAAMPGSPALARKMFGYPAGFINGRMFMGLFQDGMVMRLPEAARAELIAREGGKPFAPMSGRVMREWVVLPPAIVGDRARLGARVAKALAHAKALPPKAKATAKRAAKKKL